jgi:D-glycero-alpha-D-manno-heptose-7-phosphate kinase
MIPSTSPLRIIKALAPVRVCDIGGWTDTWFARHGWVFNIAVAPHVEVEVAVDTRPPTGDRVTIHAENFGDRYAVDPDDMHYGKHPLIEAAIEIMDVPKDLSLRINIFSAAPPGASVGTSAAVSVAIIGALAHLVRAPWTAHEVARLAHSVETEKLKLQSGVQDQLASAYGGVNLMHVESYPETKVSPISVPDPVWWELQSRLVVVYIGAPHASSVVHEKVIAQLGAGAHEDSRIERLRELAQRASAALADGDLERLGAAMVESTDVQRSLHPELVCRRFDEVISLCRESRVLGWKVNGAGGDGGSLTILSGGNGAATRALVRSLKEGGFEILDVSLSRLGLHVWSWEDRRIVRT